MSFLKNIRFFRLEIALEKNWIVKIRMKGCHRLQPISHQPINVFRKPFFQFWIIILTNQRLPTFNIKSCPETFFLCHFFYLFKQQKTYPPNFSKSIANQLRKRISIQKSLMKRIKLRPWQGEKLKLDYSVFMYEVHTSRMLIFFTIDTFEWGHLLGMATVKRETRWKSFSKRKFSLELFHTTNP